MKKLIWDSSYEIGFEIIDDQHKQIFNMVNDLIDKSNIKVDSETISDLLTKLTKYGCEHFDTEERIFEEYGYPSLEQHKEEHKVFRKKIAKLCCDTMDHRSSVPSDLIQFIAFWLKNHILKTDMKFKHYLMQGCL